MDAADGSIVLVKAINESPHPVIPKLDHTAVKTRQDPWPLTMETQSLHSITLRFKLRQHPLHSNFQTLTHTHTKPLTFNENHIIARLHLTTEFSNQCKLQIVDNTKFELLIIESHFPIQKRKID